MSYLPLFQSTLPVGGATFPARAAACCCFHFNPRSPWGERLPGVVFDSDVLDISIHAPRGGSDRQDAMDTVSHSYFNPRSPWGERLCQRAVILRWLLISIHAPRGGSDIGGMRSMMVPNHFNPRSPWGERPLPAGL